jgi:tetratricopeptide (TPR) repeat protein
LEKLVADARRDQRWSDVESLSTKLSKLPERNAASVLNDHLQIFRARTAGGRSATGMPATIRARIVDLPAEQRSDALCRFADALLDAGDARGAEDSCREALRSASGDAKAERAEKLLASSLVKQGRPDEAVRCYLAAVNKSHARGDQEAVVRGLVDMAADLAENDVETLPQDIVILIEQSIDKLSSPDALLELAALLNHENGAPLALRCVGKAMDLADRKAASGLPAKQRVRLEERLVRRCYELGQDDLAVARAGAVSIATLEDPSVNPETLSDFQLYWAYALNRSGHRPDAGKLWDAILQRTRGNPKLFPNYAACIGLALLQAGEKERGLALIEEAAAANPSDDTVCFGRLYLAWNALENGRQDVALEQALQARSHATPMAGKRWQRKTYWTAQLLEGHLKQKKGDMTGQRLMAEAKGHEVLGWVAERIAQVGSP